MVAPPSSASPASASCDAPPRPDPAAGFTRLWRRELHRYPTGATRHAQLALVVAATVVVYYQLYVQTAIATSIMNHYGMSFGYFSMVAVVGNITGACAALIAGFADRWGRANLVAYGLLATGVLTLAALPKAPNSTAFLLLTAVIAFVEGLVLVAAPALVRDLSPQVGRASAMGLWTMGPVLGSLIVTGVTSTTLDDIGWRNEIRYAGAAGIVVALVVAVFLRELAPALRNQLIVAFEERALLEARAAGLDRAQALDTGGRRVLRTDVVVPAIGVGLYLLFYFTVVGSFVVFFSTVHGYSEQRANGLGNWFWSAQAVSLILFGLLSDRLRVRKPFIVTGLIGSLILMIVFASVSTRATTGFDTFALLGCCMGVFGGMAYAPWMAGFTENVERHSPSATAAGLAVTGSATRLIVAATAIALPLVATSVTTLVDHGKDVAEAQRQATPALAVIAAHPALFAELDRHPSDAIPPELGARAYAEVGPAGLALVTQAKPALDIVKRHGADVAQASKDAPDQWRIWWWVCVAGQAIFLPTAFLIRGPWSPRRARLDAETRAAALARENDATPTTY
ncbi:MFS transporter (plasmid) [Embleya sp. NBC_00888]|uniref:MFS transporter n=1 Tax=Embleya sp. NBC_00888 TaxID=2975960 RepID=UPI002F90C354|nr:MFS transporter [Embleya sp. NBC_00888]